MLWFFPVTVFPDSTGISSGGSGLKVPVFPVTVFLVQPEIFPAVPVEKLRFIRCQFSTGTGQPGVHPWSGIFFRIKFAPSNE